MWRGLTLEELATWPPDGWSCDLPWQFWELLGSAGMGDLDPDLAVLCLAVR